MAHTKKASKAFKKWRDSVTHEVPTGPHTDVKKRKINPSFKKILTGFVPGALEGVKKVAKPFVKEAVTLEKWYRNGRKKKAKGGRANFRGGGRTNLLEELGRVEAEPSNRNRRAEISRVHGELNRGYKSGGRTGLKHGGSAGAAKRGHGAEIK